MTEQTKERCQNCKFSWRAVNMFADEFLACRRYPPIGPRGWAKTQEDRWCGEYQRIRSKDMPQTGDLLTDAAENARRAESPHPVQAVRRLNEDLFRAVSDARERGVSRQQIALRLRDQLAAFIDV